jgi:NAD(P)-dependent dehydrogenase (short-subunit alcohol dehydrogenase family)
MSKVVLITGSSGGIGSALVRTYLDDGYFVIGLDRHPSTLPKTEFYSELTVNLLIFSKDRPYRDKIIKQIKENFPKIIKKLVVINNAAEQIIKSVPEIEWQDWETSIAVNAVAPFFLVQGFVGELKQANGHVINISSIHAKLTKPKFTCYAASKSAIEAITRSLALELSPLGISVNAIAPAAIATEMLKDGFKDMLARLRELESFHPSQSIGTPEEIASFIKAITDHDGKFLTGSVLELNGGIAGKLSDPI